VTTVECPQCHQPKKPHFVCDFCGTYDGRQVIAPRDERDHAGHNHE
jgi:large subunit ribosomal protein L32